MENNTNYNIILNPKSRQTDTISTDNHHIYELYNILTGNEFIPSLGDVNTRIRDNLNNNNLI